MRFVSFLLVASLFSFGCVSEDIGATGDGHDVVSAPNCVVAVSPKVTSLVASERGVVFATAMEGTAENPSLLIQRSVGTGCDLSIDGQAPLAAAALLDQDDAGNVYVFPAHSPNAAVISTMLPDFFEGRASIVAKVDIANNISELVYAGRGIWSFGVAPEGTSLWVTACGPTGIFSVTENGLMATLTPPDSLWEQMPSVLADDQTFWSVGVRTCGVVKTITPDCGFDLVRTTETGSEHVGTSLVDVGNGFEQTTLSRCGAYVCGVLESAIVLWDANGKIARTITLRDVSALPKERIVMASGNRYGVYVLLQSEAGTRVVFMAETKAG